MTLRIKSSLLLGIIIAATLGISGYYYLIFLENSLRHSLLEGLDSVSDTSSREIHSFLSNCVKEAEAVAQALPKMAVAQKDARTIDGYLANYLGIFPKFENGMFILDKNGVLWADWPKHPETRGKSFAFRQYFKKTMAGEKGIVGEPYRSTRTGEPVVTFTAILRDVSGQVAGMLGCSVQLTSPYALEGIRLTRIGRSGYIYVYNKDRLMILHPQADRILQKDVPIGTNPLFDAAIDGFEGTGETVNSRGVAMLISMKHIPDSDWIIGAQQPLSEAFAPIVSARNEIILGIIIIFVASVVIGALLMSRITKPLNNLQAAINSLGTIGDKDSDPSVKNSSLERLAAIKGGGEIANLKTAFKTMADKLDTSMLSLKTLAHDWENTFDSVLDVIFLLDEQNNIRRANRAALALLDTSSENVSGRPVFDFLDIASEQMSAIDAVTPKTNSFNINVANDQVYEIFCNPLFKDAHQIGGKVLVGRNITSRLKADMEKLKLEEKLIKARKMEAIGTLAGGVAHDLNNILSGIVSYPELLLLQLPKDSPLVKPLETILQSGKKAAAIVQDLLSLARRGAEIFEVINLNTIIREYCDSPEYHKLKSFHPHVNETISLDPALLNIQGSAVHLSKVIMNLFSNAAEAMPDGGNIHISTENTYVDTRVRGDADFTEGEYVVLTIADEGLGIAPEDLDRIFEPFYTKKKLGHSGTGLGMSVVWGTVKDHKGFFDIQSALGSGTTFKLYFPATREDIQISETAMDLHQIRGNNETILVIDDVESQRIIATSILEQLGYSVESLSSGEAAVAYLTRHRVDLLLLDMIMKPGIDGFETYKRVIEIRPDQKAIIASGYTENKMVRQTQALGAGRYIKKPYTIETIGMAVKEELSRRPT